MVGRGGVVNLGQSCDARYLCNDCRDAAGISPVAGSVLWSELVAAEVIVFVAVGPFLLRRLTPGDRYGSRGRRVLGALGVVGGEFQHHQAIATAGAIARVDVCIAGTWSCMRVLAAIVPRELRGSLHRRSTARWALGLTSAALTLISGSLYAQFGTRGFWAMFLMPSAALPAIWRLYRARRSAITRG